MIPNGMGAAAMVEAVSRQAETLARHQHVGLDAVWRVARNCYDRAEDEILFQYAVDGLEREEGLLLDSGWPVVETAAQQAIRVCVLESRHRISVVVNYAASRLRHRDAAELLACIQTSLSALASV
jgi:hypothetical protein